MWFFCYAKNRVGNQIMVVGILLLEKIIEFFGYCGGPQSSSRENADMHIEKS